MYSKVEPGRERAVLWSSAPRQSGELTLRVDLSSSALGSRVRRRSRSHQPQPHPAGLLSPGQDLHTTRGRGGGRCSPAGANHKYPVVGRGGSKARTGWRRERRAVLCLRAETSGRNREEWERGPLWMPRLLTNSLTYTHTPTVKTEAHSH